MVARGVGDDEPERLADHRRASYQEQIDAQQVALVVDLLVRRDGRYEEVVPHKVYRKIA